MRDGLARPANRNHRAACPQSVAAARCAMRQLITRGALAVDCARAREHDAFHTTTVRADRLDQIAGSDHIYQVIARWLVVRLTGAGLGGEVVNQIGIKGTDGEAQLLCICHVAAKDLTLADQPGRFFDPLIPMNLRMKISKTMTS